MHEPFATERDYGDEPYGVEDLDPLGDRLFTIGVPPNASDEFKRYVFAAGKTLRLGNRSVDYMLRAYGEHWNLRDHRGERSVVVLAATKAAKASTRAAIERIVHVPDKPGRLGLFAAVSALLRLQTTLRALTFTVRHGFSFESAALLRMVLEQLAWSVAIHRREDSGIFKVRPQSTLRSLTTVIPDAGKLYGLLSEHAHIHPDETLRYIEFASGEPMIRMSFRNRNDADVLRMLTIADYYIIVCEIVGAELPLTRHATEGIPPKIVVRSKRPFLDVVRRYEDELARVDVGPPPAGA